MSGSNSYTMGGGGEVGMEYHLVVVYCIERWCFFLVTLLHFAPSILPVASSSKTHLIKESIRLAFNDLGAFHYERGDLNASLKTRHQGPFNLPFGKPKWRWKDVHLHPSMGKCFSSLLLLSAVLFLRQSTAQSNFFHPPVCRLAKHRNRVDPKFHNLLIALIRVILLLLLSFAWLLTTK